MINFNGICNIVSLLPSPRFKSVRGDIAKFVAYTSGWVESVGSRQLIEAVKVNLMKEYKMFETSGRCRLQSGYK